MAILAECPMCHKKQKTRNKKCSGCESAMNRAPLAVLDDAGMPDEDKLNQYDKPVNFAKCVRFWINYTLPGGKQKREFVGYSHDIAKTSESKRMVQRYENPRILQKAPDERMTFQELTDWYLGLEKVKSKAYYPTVKFNLATFNAEFGSTILSQVLPVDLENFQAKLQATYADSYVDNIIGAAKTMVNKAFDNDLVGGETVKAFKWVKKLLKRNANARDRILTTEEFSRLLDLAPWHIKAVLVTGFYTGMRRGEILSLTWDKVDMAKRVIKLEADDTKDREPRTVPICPQLHDILKSIPRALHDNHVFLYKGKPVKSIKKGLVRVCKDAGIDYGRFVKGGFVFHDLRHCFNTYMRKAGVAESVIMEITGHSTRVMFDRYNRIDVEDAHQAIDQLGSFLANLDQTLDQDAK